MVNHAFTVSKTANSPSHRVTVRIPSYEDATDAQRRTMWAEGVDSVTIKTQGVCRRALPDCRGDALNAKASAHFNAVINATRVAAAVPTFDAKELNLNAEQVAAFEAKGWIVTNKDEPTQDA